MGDVEETLRGPLLELIHKLRNLIVGIQQNHRCTELANSYRVHHVLVLIGL